MKKYALLMLLISTTCFAVSQPDRKLTPGRVDNSVTKEELCTPGYLQAHSEIPADVKMRVLHRYGVQLTAPVEIDNLVSVEVGGSQTDVRNLWPQDVCPVNTAGVTCFGIQEKNVVEASLYQRICQNQISMADAQELVRSGRWVQEYRRLAASQPQAAPSQTQLSTGSGPYPVKQ